MIRPTVAFVRATGLLTDALVARYVAAQQVQVTRDFAPEWRVDAECVLVHPGGSPPGGAWEVVLLDDSDQADALGYHDLSAPGNLPRSRVFVADDLAAGNSWTVTASHEVLEMLADPAINMTRVVGDREYSFEVCDACEDDRFAYPIDGVHLTDFVLPAWFDPGAKGDEESFTFGGRTGIVAPFGLAVGGYIGRRRLPDGEWEQALPPDGALGRRAVKGPASRTMRRFAKA